MDRIAQAIEEERVANMENHIPKPVISPNSDGEDIYEDAVEKNPPAKDHRQLDDLDRAVNPNHLEPAAIPEQDQAALPPQDIEGDAAWEDYDPHDESSGDELDEDMVANMLNEAFGNRDDLQDQMTPITDPAFETFPSTSSHIAADVDPTSNPEAKAECLDTVMKLFPRICPDYLSSLYGKFGMTSQQLVAHILDQMDQGVPYRKVRPRENSMRKAVDLDEDIRKYGAEDRIVPFIGGKARTYIRTIFGYEFSDIPLLFIDIVLEQCGHRLFLAYQILGETYRTYDPKTSPYIKLKRPRSHGTLDFSNQKIEELIKGDDVLERELLIELQAARRIKCHLDTKFEEERAAQLEEEANTSKAQAEGTMAECGCCCDDFPLNRMVHCNADDMHWFCKGCALKNAQTQIGNSGYELRCMAMDGCNELFSRVEMSRFLDEKTLIALERIEQETNLRMAGIENLASCPFCPFAAEYPSVEIDREFRCLAPDCEKVSCRLCNLESHIPLSCGEHANETGLSIRRQIEEAMSAALIRNCNKCGTPFIKEEGCNKMTCTRAGCRNMQCYVCSKSCGYDHFNDPSRGGRIGNCPLFEDVETRHENEVSKAEKEVLERVLLEHPEYNEEDLKIKVSDRVKMDEGMIARLLHLGPPADNGVDRNARLMAQARRHFNFEEHFPGFADVDLEDRHMLEHLMEEDDEAAGLGNNREFGDLDVNDWLRQGLAHQGGQPNDDQLPQVIKRARQVYLGQRVLRMHAEEAAKFQAQNVEGEAPNREFDRVVAAQENAGLEQGLYENDDDDEDDEDESDDGDGGDDEDYEDYEDDEDHEKAQEAEAKKWIAEHFGPREQ